MSALRPSNELKNKTNIYDVGDRMTEATAEDFNELGVILESHADLIDTLSLFKTFVIASSMSILSTHNNATLFVANNTDLTLKPDLPAVFGCIVKIRETADFTCNILAGDGVTLEPANPVLTKGKMCSIIRYPGTDTFIISGDI